MSEAIISHEELLGIFERAALIRSKRLAVPSPDQRTIDKIKNALDQPIYYSSFAPLKRLKIRDGVC
jgi:hypothetical protein